MASCSNLSSLFDTFTATDDKMSVLQQIKVVVNNTSRRQLEDDVHNMSFNMIFDSLMTFDSEVRQLCCAVLSSLFMALSPATVIENYSKRLQQGLTVENEAIQILSLSQLKRISSEQFEMHVAKDHQFLTSLINLLAANDLQIASDAAKVLGKFGECPGSLNQLFHTDLKATLETVMKTKDVVRFRVYELLVSLATPSQRNMTHVMGSGLLNHLLRELYDTGDRVDVLAKMNCVELLSALAATKHGFVWLTDHSVLDKLQTLLVEADSDPMLGFLEPGLLTFFGRVARHRPKEICSKYDHFINKVLASLNCSDMTLRVIGVESIAHIASSIEGKKTLKNYASKMDEALKNVGHTIQNCPEEVKVRTLSALAVIIGLQPEDQNEEMLGLTKHWFCQISANPFKMVMTISQQPFPNMRIASKTVFLSLSNQTWGVKLMADHPTFVEYLLDRRTEHTAEDKRLKYEIVDSVVGMGATAEEVFGSPNFLKLRSYQKQGPFYVQSESAVSMEGES
ncbi:26S proteasome non-ATPase regulatory subunit 5-like [Argonauta hians]